MFTCRLFPLSPFPEAAKSQKALGAAHEQQGLRPARATRTRRATASAATKATGKHRQAAKQQGETARRADQHNQGQRLSLAHMQRGATKAATQLSAAAAEAAASAAAKVAPRAATAIAAAAAAAK